MNTKNTNTPPLPTEEEFVTLVTEIIPAKAGHTSLAKGGDLANVPTESRNVPAATLTNAPSRIFGVAKEDVEHVVHIARDKELTLNEKVVTFYNLGLRIDDIASLVGTSVPNVSRIVKRAVQAAAATKRGSSGISEIVIRRNIKNFLAKKGQEKLTPESLEMSGKLKALCERMLNNMLESDDEFKVLKLVDQAKIFNVLYDKYRLESGQSTDNKSIILTADKVQEVWQRVTSGTAAKTHIQEVTKNKSE